MLVVLGIDIGNVQEAIAAYAEIDEGCLDARLNIDNFTTVNVADEALLLLSFDVEFFEHAIFEDSNAHLFVRHGIDQHFLADTLAGDWASTRNGTLYFRCHAFFFLNLTGLGRNGV